MNILKPDIENKFYKAASSIAQNMIFFPKIAVIAGSGIMDALKDIDIVQTIDYSETGILPDPTVEGHKKQIIFARHNNIKFMIFTGRYHLYEGYTPLETAYPVILSYYLGIKNLILTNAAGGINPLFKAGELMMINNIIDFSFNSYHHNFSLGAISKKYKKQLIFDQKWQEKLEKSLTIKSTPFKMGTYTQVSGPNYETRAEIRMLRKLGADVVGMSTGIESQFASMLNINCIAASMITNKSSDVEIKAITHNEVLETALSSAWKIRNFIRSAIETAEIIK